MKEMLIEDLNCEKMPTEAYFHPFYHNAVSGDGIPIIPNYP